LPSSHSADVPGRRRVERNRDPAAMSAFRGQVGRCPEEE
jgi:hypothetical protein